MSDAKPLQTKFKTAFGLHQQGRLSEAAKIYEEILGADRRHFAALHCLGAIHFQTGNLEKSVALISDAVRINPNIAATDVYRGAALNQLNRHSEALAACDESLRLKPDFPEAHYNRGNALHGLGRLAEALGSYDRAIALRNNFAEAWSNRANALQGLKRFDQALASADRAIALKPEYAPAWYNRGNALYDLGRLDEALGSYNRAVECKPNYAQAWYNRGKTLHDLKRLDQALASYDKAVVLKPDYVQAWCNRGNVLNDAERFEDAIASYDKALALKSDYAEAWSNRGTALQYLYRLDEALACHDKAIALYPDYAEAHCNRGSVLNCFKRLPEALHSFDRAIALKPGFARAHFNKAITELGLGDMPAGWRDFEWRLKIAEMSGTRVFPRPRLNTRDEARGRTVLVHFEHGFGDTIQFCRYLPLLHQAGAKILFHVQGKLKRMMGTLGVPMEFVDLDDPSRVYDYHVPLMSLPLVFGTRVDTVPAPSAYLSAEEGLVAKWGERLGGDGFRIGICWQGNTSHLLGDRRCFPVNSFAPVAALPGVRLISLQKDGGSDPLQAGFKIESFDDLDAGPDAFIDTAAVMKVMDLVITNDTSISHLAGALGVPTWIALQFVPDWRWMLDRADSPWYPSLRLFRQNTDGDWQAVFEEMTQALQTRLANASKP
jgi:tetratricopeptide (TPR) repeat protein